MAIRMQQRRGTASQWTTANPILNAGEIGFETDTNKFKIGDGTNHWADLDYFVDEASLGTTLGDYVETSLLAAANGVATLNASGKLETSQVPDLAQVTVHAVANEAARLALTVQVGDIAIQSDNGQTYVLNATPASTNGNWSAITVADPFPTHDTDDLSEGSTNQYFTDARAKTSAASLLTNATLTNITISGNGSGLTITAENGVADSNTDNLSEGSTNKYFTDERAQDAVGNAVGSGLSYNDSTGAISVDTTTIQARVADVSDTEIGYLNGVTSAIQTQIDSKAATAGATFTGAVEISDATESTSTSTGAVKTAGGLGVAKNAYIGGDLTISGDFTVNGTTTTVSTQDLIVNDPLIYIGENNTANSVDLGVVASYDDGTYQHTGLVRDASAGVWKLFKGVTDEPTTTVNFGQGSLDDLQVAGLTASSITLGDVSNTEFGYLNGVTSGIQDQLDDKAPLESPTFTGTVSGITSSMVGLGNVENTALSTWTGSSNITTLGTISSGTWNGTTIAIANGGTGATTASSAAANLLPDQSSNSGKYLTTDGNGTLSWGTVSGYSAPTIGSTSIASGATVTTIVGLTKIRSDVFTTLDANGYEVDLETMQIMGAF